MPTLKLNARQRTALYNILAQRKGAGARSICRALYRALSIEDLEEQQDKNAAKIEALLAAGTIARGQNVSRKLAKQHDVAIFDWNDPPASFEVEMTALEQARKAFAAELEKEDSAALAGSDWNVDDIKDELDRAYEAAKASSKSDGKKDSRSSQKAENHDMTRS